VKLVFEFVEIVIEALMCNPKCFFVP